MRYLWMAVLGLLTACDQTPVVPAEPRPALVVTVGDQTTPAPDILIGEVRSRYESAQGFRVGGKILQRLVDTGATVKKGQLLAKLDPLDSQLSSQAAQADVSAAQADFDLAETELKRQRQLHERHFISTQALDIQEAKFKAAAARVKQLRAQAAVVSNQSRYSELLAETDGVVTDIHAEPGQVVSAGEVIVRLAVPTAMEVEIDVPESRMSAVRLETPAEVRFWANPQKVYNAKVREIAPAADTATRTYQLRVSLTDADNEVRLGMTAGVRFYHQGQAWLLPLAAVTQREGQPIVWVVAADTHQVQPKAVKTQAFREDGAVISAGLQGGEQVVIAGVHALVPGQVVRPVEVREH